MDETNKYEMAQCAMYMATEMYRRFFENLTTAITNSMKNFEGACWTSALSDMRCSAYYAGKYDAFGEIAHRLEKERDIAMNTMSDEDRRAYESIDRRVRDDIEKLFPPKEWSGRVEWHKMMQLETAIGRLLETYAKEGFRLGKEISERGNGGQEFNPEEVAKIFRDTFIPREYVEMCQKNPTT